MSSSRSTPPVDPSNIVARNARRLSRLARLVRLSRVAARRRLSTSRPFSRAADELLGGRLEQAKVRLVEVAVSPARFYARSEHGERRSPPATGTEIRSS